MPYYGISNGRTPGVYKTWDDAKRQIYKFPGAKYQKFDKEEEAYEYITKTKIEETCEALVCFTDGACISNGKKEAKAGWAVVWPDKEEHNHSEKLEGSIQTNNRAEYSAAIHALKKADELDPSKEKPLKIYTDSMLLVRTMEDWIDKWKLHGWVKSDGGQIANIDLVKELDDLKMQRKTIWKHVRAHTGKQDWESINNDKVDKLAQASLV